MGTHPHTSYLAYYTDPRNDDYQGNYEDIMRMFTTMIQPQGQLDAHDLHDTVFTTRDQQIHAYLMYVQDVSTLPRITVIHHPNVYSPTMGRGGRVLRLALLGDVWSAAPPQLVSWPTQAFEQTDIVAVPSPNQIDAVLGVDHDLDLIGPFAAEDQGITTITTLKMMYLPPKYIHLALGRYLSPREAWERIGGAIRAEAHPVPTDLAPLLNWLRVSVTKFDHTNVIQTRINTPTPPIPYSPQLQDYHGDLVADDLPLWNAAAPATGMTTGTEHVVAAVNNLAAELVRGRQEEATQRIATTTKMPEQYYGNGILALYRYTHATSQAQLPPLYGVVANTTKKNLCAMIGEHLQGVGHELGQEMFVPTVTPDLANRISSGTYHHVDRDNLSDGVQPFITPALDPVSKTELHLNIAAYDTIVAGATAQLTDLAALQAAHKIHLPRSILQANHQFKSFRILLHGILGGDHPLTITYASFVLEFEAQQSQIEQLADTLDYPAQLVRWVQLRLTNWFNRQYLHPGHVPPPNLLQLFDDIANEVPWKPRIPGLPLMIPTARGGTATTMSSSTVSTPTGVMKPDHTRVPNSSYQTDLQRFKDSGVSLSKAHEQAKEAGSPIPTNGKGTEVCLSYHVLGFCWENCARAEDHWAHTKEEHKALLEWCTSSGLVHHSLRLTAGPVGYTSPTTATPTKK